MDGPSPTSRRKRDHTAPPGHRAERLHPAAGRATGDIPPSACPRRGGRCFPSGYLVPGVVATGALAIGLLGAADPGRPPGPPAARAAEGSASARAAVSSLPQPSLSYGTLLVRLPWGDGPGQVGLAAPKEGVTRGPEALAVRPDGSVVLLDSVNRRLLVLDPRGTVTATLPVPLASPRFLAVDDERAFVLDADEDHRMVALDAEGHVAEDVSIARADEPVTGLFVRAGRPLLETGHGRVTEVPDAPSRERAAVAGGPPAAAPVALDSLAPAAGRPAAGQWLSARFAPGTTPSVEVRGPTGAIQRRSLPLDPALPIEHLVALGGDDRGRVVVGARLLARGPAEERGEPAFLVGRWETGARGASPNVTDSLLLPESHFAEVGEPFVVAPDGALYQPFPEASGLSILVHRFPEGGGL